MTDILSVHELLVGDYTKVFDEYLPIPLGFVFDTHSDVASHGPVGGVFGEELETNWLYNAPRYAVPAPHSDASSSESVSESPSFMGSAEDSEGAERMPAARKMDSEGQGKLRARKRSDASVTVAMVDISVSKRGRRASTSSLKGTSPQVVPAIKSKRARAMERMAKRDTHNDSERQRRSEMKSGLISLKQALPHVEGLDRMNTGQLLEYAISFIRDIVDEETRFASEKLKLVNENTRLTETVLRR